MQAPTRATRRATDTTTPQQLHHIPDVFCDLENKPDHILALVEWMLRCHGALARFKDVGDAFENHIRCELRRACDRCTLPFPLARKGAVFDPSLVSVRDLHHLFRRINRLCGSNTGAVHRRAPLDLAVELRRVSILDLLSANGRFPLSFVAITFPKKRSWSGSAHATATRPVVSFGGAPDFARVATAGMRAAFFAFSLTRSERPFSGFSLYAHTETTQKSPSWRLRVPAVLSSCDMVIKSLVKYSSP